MIIQRWECRCLKQSPWTLLYGRRKTGKTWLLQNCTDWDTYVTLTPDSGCLIINRETEDIGLHDPQKCPQALAQETRASRTLVIDEVQRATPLLQEIIATRVTNVEQAYLAASGMGALKRIMGPKSPLLGHFTALRIGTAHLADALASLEDQLPPSHAVMWSVIVKDPWITRHVSPRGSPEGNLANKISQLHSIAQGLLGEVFRDEERTLTRTYETLITLVARGKWNTRDLAATLYNIGLTPSPDPSSITSHLNVLEQSGLLEKTRLWKTRGARTLYRIASPLLAMLLSTPEPHPPPAASTAWLRNHIRTILAREAPFEIAKLLAEHKNLTPAHTILPPPRGDIDIVLLDRKGSPQAAYEVKLGRVTKDDARKLLDNARELRIPYTGVVSLSQDPPEPHTLGVNETLGPHDLMRIAREVRRRLWNACSPNSGKGQGVGSINPTPP